MKISIVLIALLVLLGTSIAASSCPTIDVKPYSCPNPINLKNHGVMTVAVDGAAFNDIYEQINMSGKTSADALDDFQVLEVNLQKSPSGYASNYYTLDFDEDATRLALENVLIAPCCSGASIPDDGNPDLLIKLKDLNYNGELPKGEYYLYIVYTLNNKTNIFCTELDCVRVI